MPAAPTNPTTTTPTAATATAPQPPASSGNPDVPTATSSTQAPGQPLHFEGTGTTKLGTVKVSKDSVLSWTSAGRTFAVTDKDFKIKIQATEQRGTAPLKAGAYSEVEVDASGKWTIDIKPG